MLLTRARDLEALAWDEDEEAAERDVNDEDVGEAHEGTLAEEFAWGWSV